jgi:Zn-dependent peptidase ImmA (M78 family)/transcriptional regulator with XRE-family HTH domain
MATGVTAADAAALFSGHRLRLARQLAGMRKSDLAQLLGKSATALSGWEAESKRPSPATVAELALSLGVDPGFFMVGRDQPALAATPHFRSLRSTTQIARDQATAYGHLALDVAAAMERHVEFPDVTIPYFPVPPDDADGVEPEDAARFVRRQWGLATGPVGHLVRLLENHGVVVVFSPPGAVSVDAYSFEGSGKPVVILNPFKQDYYRQRFDVAHELGHLVMHQDAEPGGRTVEDQANRFAAEFLMPESDIRESLPKTMSRSVWTSIGQLKERFGVSMQAILFRARRLGELSDVSYRNAMMTVSARGWRRSEPGLVDSVEQPSMLPRAVEILDEAGISELELISQSRVPVELFRQVVSRFPTDPHFSDASVETGSHLAPVVSLMDAGRGGA